MGAEPSGRIGRLRAEELSGVGDDEPPVEAGATAEVGELWKTVDDDLIEEAAPACFWTPGASATLFETATSSLIPAPLAAGASELAAKISVALVERPPGELLD